MTSTALPITFILAEDNEGHAHLFRKHLRREQLKNTLIHAIDGQIAVDTIESVSDADRAAMILILDLNMPRLDGMQVLERLSTPSGATKIPVIILSTTKDDTEVARCYKAGSRGYLSKPLSPGDLSTAVRALGPSFGEQTVDDGTFLTVATTGSEL